MEEKLKLKSLEVGQVIKMDGGTLTIVDIKLRESALGRGNLERWYTRVWYTYHSTVTGETSEDSTDSKILLASLREDGVI